VTARELMTLNPVMLTARATLADAWRLMREHEVRHVPIVDGGVLIGILSDRDLAREDVARVLMAEGAAGLERELRTPVVTVMAADPICVEPETSASEILDLLIEAKVGALPVVEPDTRAVVGIVSYIDVLRMLQGAVATQNA